MLNTRIDEDSQDEDDHASGDDEQSDEEDHVQHATSSRARSEHDALVILSPLLIYFILVIS